MSRLRATHSQRRPAERHSAGLILALLCAMVIPGCSFDLYRQPPDGAGDQGVLVDGRADRGSPDGPTRDTAVLDGAVADKGVTDKTAAFDTIKPPLDTIKPPPDTIKPPPDTTKPPPDQTLPPDQTPPDQTLPPPDQFSCPPSVLDENMGSSTGWVQMAGSSAAQILGNQIYVPLNQYASVLHSSAAGLVCVPPGKGLDIALSASCASGTVSVALYDVYCTASTCNMKTAVKVCNLSCSASSEVVYSCTATAQEAGGRWIYAARVGRSANGGSTVTFTHLKAVVP